MRRTASAAALLSLCAASAWAAPGTIVADMPATGSLVQQVLGDLGEVRVLLPQGASVHHYQMRPSDAQALQSADLLVWIGPALTPWLARASDNLGGNAAQLQLLEVEGTHLQDYAAPGGHDHDHDHDHGEDHAHGHDGHDHAHGHDHDHSHDHDHDHDHDHSHDHSHEGTDPHAWLDPDNAVLWLDAIARSLAEHDPENAATYAANAAAAQADIAALSDEIAARLAPFSESRIVVFHDAYGYFTGRFDLPPAIPLSLGDASTPSAARIEQIRTAIVETGATCAFPEYAHDARLIDTAIEGSAVRLGAVLDPQGGASQPGPQQYQAMLRDMADGIANCLEAE